MLEPVPPGSAHADVKLLEALRTFAETNLLSK